jgi:hypothetical protein
LHFTFYFDTRALRQPIVICDLKMGRFSFSALASSMLLTSMLPAAQAMSPGADIPLVNVDPSTVTVSGISAGAFMAAQMHVAWSTLIKGSGMLAGTLHSCA